MLVYRARRLARMGDLLLADKVYARLFLEWGGRCAYCDIELNRVKNYGARKYKQPKGSVDHFIPLSKGGKNHRANRVLACRPCNELKADADPRDEAGQVVRWVPVWYRLEAIAASPMLTPVEMRKALRERAEAQPTAVTPAARPARTSLLPGFLSNLLARVFRRRPAIGP